ncbi:hypothetical protein [Oceanisphaera sp. IT1-181]|uniref:hypothetical protein n=1 Tax=Oceanisphaera sp. IT1-181 TaxID=3081199 RepID=UPI0029CA60E3|nr:hypothetical protein [Oceanisphaera sp. IT1-181]
MNRDLTPRERKLLHLLSSKLQYKSRVIRKLKGADLSILAWCEAQDLLLHSVVPLANSDVEYGYNAELIQAIEMRLVLLGLAPLVADMKVSSLEQAKLGTAEHKSVRIKPREQRVLHLDNIQIIDQDQSELAVEQYSEIVVVEPTFRT